MANTDIGKKFESRFKQDYQRCCPDTLIYRLPDQQSGYAGGLTPLLDAEGKPIVSR